MEASSSPPSSVSLVSRARTALHSAAAKAEKVLTDITKADSKSDRESDGQSHKGSGMSMDRESCASPDSSRTREEVLEMETIEGEGDSILHAKPNFPPASLIKQLAVAIETGRTFQSMDDLRSVGDPLFSKEKTGLSLSVVKSFVLREKDEKLSYEFADDEMRSLICSLFKSEEKLSQNKTEYTPEAVHSSSVSKDLHGAPPGSFVHQVSEIIGGIGSLQKMAFLWHHTVFELRNLWSKEQPIPWMPLDADPDLNSCLLHQELQVINCCIARKKRRAIAKESLESALKQETVNCSNSVDASCKKPLDNKNYARTSDGGYVLRLGADHPSENLTMLETDEPIYSPVMQEGPILTEQLIKETEEFVLRTGSVGAGCSQLLSDMQAFKAANPGCVLEDFIRWHSPPDWTGDGQPNDPDDEGGLSRRGRLSDRMQKTGNLWHELWETAKALPAVEQSPLFDEDLAVESIFNTLEDIQPSDFFEQLFRTLLSTGIVAAEAALPADSNLYNLFFECKDYIIAISQGEMSKEKLDDICKVYETLEAMVVHPEEALMIMEQPDRKSTEMKSRFKKIGMNFIGKDRQPPWKRPPKDEKKPDEKHVNVRSKSDEKHQDHISKPDEKHQNVFSHLLDKSVPLFSKKNSKPDASSAPAPAVLDDSEWTMV